MSRRRINLNTPGFVHRPSPPPRKPGSKVPSYVLPGFDHLEYGIEPHIDFRFQTRLRDEQRLRDPEQPFPGDPLPDESAGADGVAAVERAQAAAVRQVGKREAAGHKVVTLLSARLRARQAALEAVAREERFRKIQPEFQRQRTVLPRVSTRSIIKVTEGGVLDPALIEDREYDFAEVVGPESRFHFRLISWGAG
jgi:hypothetical protein